MKTHKAQIYQTGTLNSLMEAVYDGDLAIDSLLSHGDFGIGAFDSIDGEMIIFDGVCYRANAYGHLNVVDRLNKTPFAMVSKFKPDIEFMLDGCNFAALEEYLKDYFISHNLMYTIEITGSFRKVDLRSEHCTCKPYRRLTEILPDLQTTYTLTDVSGVMVGMWFPKYMGQLNVPGFHFHFIDNERRSGGHVFGLELIQAKCRMQIIHGFQMELLATQEFYQVDLNRTTASEVAIVEQIRE